MSVSHRASSPGRPAYRRASVFWLAAGIAVGAVGTFGVVLLITGLAPGESRAEASGPPRFVDESQTAGVDHVYDGEFHFFVGGGVAVFDCDDDFKSDLYFAGGVNTAALFRNQSSSSGELLFTAIRSPTTDLTNVTGAYPLDVDSDGITDLAVLRLGENVMLRGLGGCRFERANELWGIDGGDEWTVSFSAKWDGTDRLPTLAFGNYIALTDTGEQTTGCADSHLFVPSEGDYGTPVKLKPGWCTLSILFSDWDRTGRRDLRMTNDRHYYRDGEEQLWRLDADEPPRLYGRDDAWQKLKIWGMGIASHDLDGDSFPEVFLTSQGDNKLQTLASGPEQPNYEDIALASGVTAHRPFIGDNSRPSTAWHAEFDDVNNDGLIDLFVTKGNVDAMPDFAENDPNNLLLGQPGGTFVESANEAGMLDNAKSRGGALADLNLDGMLDMVVVERRERVKVWRNVGTGSADAPEPMGNWVAIDLFQDAANTDGIGSWIEMRSSGRTVEREATVGGGHAGGALGWIHFGLGEATDAEVRVTWPNGETGAWLRVEANGFVLIERGRDTATEWNPLSD